MEDEGGELFDMEHSYIDFRTMRLGKKIDSISGEQTGTSKFFKPKNDFDDFFLSKMINGTEGNKEFFVQPSTKRLIDYQFEETKPMVQRLMIIYLAFFYIPFMSTFFHDTRWLELAATITGLIVQSAFFCIELI
jgi:hypothetical protein